MTVIFVGFSAQENEDALNALLRGSEVDLELRDWQTIQSPTGEFVTTATCEAWRGGVKNGRQEAGGPPTKEDASGCGTGAW